MKTILSASSLIVSTASYAAPHPVELALYTQDFPPLQVEVDGVAEGYVIKFVEAVVQDAARTLPMTLHQVHFTPWKRAMRITQTRKNALLVSVSRTPIREDKFHWIGEVSPYEVSIFRHINGPSLKTDQLQALKDYRFGAQTEGSFEELIRSLGFKQIIPVNYGKDAIRLLRANRVDYAPLVTVSYPYRMAQYGFDPSNFVEVMKVKPLCKALWLVTGKQTSPEVVEALRQSFEKLKAEGELSSLIEAYQPENPIMLRYQELASK
ncbi:transporter substrate-binding domain-containing protein [Vibrio sp. Isolate25]|uniref:substrate-binding periplasmic protein n=1 Tax=Vibrio TaxID=662 RepID=UPI001EFE1C53|nr:MULTISPECIES: transporter substrate-binding domain-containing protein [Vibrio]MCG9596154.1 transporter substrate-binding domain-containing protein [Vibrio sp. Isolate25]MCG9676817.1 transporter substrate-binding domain-containing protein [Vibrio sp. Isolate24]